MSVYIFLTTFFFRIPQSAHFSFPLVIFLSRGRVPISSLFIMLLSLSLSFLRAPPERVRAFCPEKWIFSFGKKKSEKSADSLHEARGSRFWSACKRSSTERTNKRQPGQRERAEEKGVAGGGGRIQSKTAMVAEGKMKTTHLRERREREGETGEEKRVVSRKVEI